MNCRRYDLIVTATVVLMLVVVSVGRANASSILRLDAGGANFVEISDNGAGDLNGALGAILYSGTLGNFVVNATIGTSKPLLPTNPYIAQLDLNSLNVISAGSGALIVTFADTDFLLAQSPATVTASIGGNLSAPAGSTLTAQAWLDPTNAPLLPGLVLPGGSVPVYVPLAFTTGPGGFLGADTELIGVPGMFALWQRTTINLTGPGFVSYDFHETATVPEPASLVMLGSGLLGLSAAVRRRRRQAAGKAPVTR